MTPAVRTMTATNPGRRQAFVRGVMGRLQNP